MKQAPAACILWHNALAQRQSQIKKEQETMRFVQAIRFSPELKFRSTPSAFDAQF